MGQTVMDNQQIVKYLAMCEDTLERLPPGDPARNLYLREREWCRQQLNPEGKTWQ